MTEPYVPYLEAKRDELEAQVKLLVATVYYKEAVIRRHRAEIEQLQRTKET